MNRIIDNHTIEKVKYIKIIILEQNDCELYNL